MYMLKNFKWGLVNINSFNGIVLEVIEFLLYKAYANVAKHIGLIWVCNCNYN